jgi:hypothetical protein
MAFASTIKYYASNTNDAIDKIKDTMVSAGWTLHDDLSGSSPYGYVMTASGTLDTDWPMYLYLYNTSEQIYSINYLYWDNSTHTGNVRIASNVYAKVNGSTSSFYIWVAATEENVAFCTYVSNTMRSMWIGQINPVDPNPAIGVLQSSVTAGSDVTLTLDVSEADRFIINTPYQILDNTSREVTTVTAIDTAAKTLTVDSLSENYDAGSRVGLLPYRWIVWVATGSYCYGLNYEMSGTADSTNYSNGSVNADIFSYSYVDPDMRSARYLMWPILFYEYSSASAVFGIMPVDNNTVYLRSRLTTDKELPMAVGYLDSGTSSGSNDSTTLNDTSKSWSTNAFANKVLVIMAGLGAGQFRTISSNTGTSLTITPAFDTVPDGSSEYVIAEQGWVYLYINNQVGQSAAMRML